MRLLISIAIVTASMLGCVSEASAGLAFQLERTFTIPGLSGTIRQMKFNDIDGDGTPEVLGSTIARVVLYSISGDSIIFSAVPDLGYEVTAIELADVNRDSVVDVVVALGQGLFTNVGICYSGSSDFQLQARCTLISRDPYERRTALLVAHDFNRDGYNELFFAFEYDIMWDIWSQDYGGETMIYRSFPGAIIDTADAHFDQVMWLWWESQQAHFVGMSYDAVHSMGWNNDLTRAVIVDTAGAFKWLPTIKPGDYCLYTEGSVSSTSRVLCGGELDSDTTTDELLMSLQAGYACYDNGELINSGDTSVLRLYRFEAPATCVEVWSKYYSGQSYTDYIYHPGLPGYYFAFSADTLVLFRGIDGSVHSKLKAVPAGNRYWDYPYADGVPRLIVTTGQQVSLYELDVSTVVNDEPDQSLPTSFVLGQPYPNPFNAELTIPITLSKSRDMTIDVFNINGERVARLHEGQQKAGENLVRWEAKSVSSGIYLIRAQSAGETRTVKAVLLK